MYLALSKTYLHESKKSSGSIFAAEINKYIESFLDHYVLIREDGLAVQKILQKIETPAGPQITMIPFFEVPQERKRLQFLEKLEKSEKAKSNLSSYISTPDKANSLKSSPDKTLDSLIKNDFKLSPNQATPSSIHKNSPVTESTPQIILTEASSEKPKESDSPFFVKTQARNIDDKVSTQLFQDEKKAPKTLASSRKGSTANSTSQLSTGVNTSLSSICPELPPLDSPFFEYLKDLESPSQMTLYATTGLTSLFAGTIPELPKSLIQTRVNFFFPFNKKLGITH